MNDARNCTESCKGSRDRSDRRHCVSSDVGTSTGKISTREGAFHLMSKVLYIKHEKGACHLISKLIYQTREGVFHLISKHRELIYQTRGGVFHLIS